MDKFQAKDLTINVVFDEKMAVEALVEGFKAVIRKAVRCERTSDRPQESAHASCHCSGVPVIFPSGHVPGEKSTYHIRCGSCGREPLFEKYEPVNQPPAHIDFSSEEEALAVWDAVMRAGLSNG